MTGELAPTRRGYSPYEVISALQKAIRRSDADAAVYWAAELTRSGYENWLWKRLRVIASEDIGPAAPGIATEVRTLHELWRGDQRGEGTLHLVHAVLLLARAPKSHATDWALMVHWSDHTERREIPDEAQDMHTHRGKKMGRGMQHFIDGGPSVLVQPDPDDLGRLEAEWRERYRRIVQNDPTLPVNAWPPRESNRLDSEPALNAHPRESGQLRIETDVTREGE